MLLNRKVLSVHSCIFLFLLWILLVGLNNVPKESETLEKVSENMSRSTKDNEY